jgi:hypothetical protein
MRSLTGGVCIKLLTKLRHTVHRLLGDDGAAREQEVALRQRMLSLGLSVFEPNPLEAIERAETEAAKSEGATEPSPAEPVA